MELALEEADPESVARENERLLEVKAMTPLQQSGATGRVQRRTDSGTGGDHALDGAEQSAAQALLEFSEANPRQALYHWLKLLDIYRGSGHRKDFKETAEKLRQRFNIQAEDWTRTHGGAKFRRWKALTASRDTCRSTGRSRRSASPTCSTYWKTTARVRAPDSSSLWPRKSCSC